MWYLIHTCHNIIQLKKKKFFSVISFLIWHLDWNNWILKICINTCTYFYCIWICKLWWHYFKSKQMKCCSSVSLILNRWQEWQCCTSGAYKLVTVCYTVSASTHLNVLHLTHHILFTPCFVFWGIPEFNILVKPVSLKLTNSVLKITQ